MARSMALAALLALALPLPGAVARSIAPPGNSEADQYFETLPDTTGPRSQDSSRSRRDAVQEGSLSAETAAALARRGIVGRALADAVAATTPSNASAIDAKGRAATGKGSAPGGRGLGVAFPLALGSAALAAFAFGLARRGSRTVS